MKKVKLSEVKLGGSFWLYDFQVGCVRDAFERGRLNGRFGTWGFGHIRCGNTKRGVLYFRPSLDVFVEG